MLFSALPDRQGLYDPENETDSCGVAMVADIQGRRSHAIVADGLIALEHLDHRGAAGAEPNSGDGAGILIQLPVELLTEVRVFADQLARAARQLLVGRLARLPEVHGAPALGRFVRDPRLEAQPGNLLERVDGLVTEVAAQLPDRRLRVGEVPEDEAQEHSARRRKLGDERLDLAEDVRFVVGDVACERNLGSQNRARLAKHALFTGG